MTAEVSPKVSEEALDNGLTWAFRGPLLLKAISPVRREVSKRKWWGRKYKTTVYEDQVIFDKVPVKATVNKRERKINLWSDPFPMTCGSNTNLVVYKADTGEFVVSFHQAAGFADGNLLDATVMLTQI